MNLFGTFLQYFKNDIRLRVAQGQHNSGNVIA